MINDTNWQQDNQLKLCCCEDLLKLKWITLLKCKRVWFRLLITLVMYSKSTTYSGRTISWSNTNHTHCLALHSQPVSIIGLFSVDPGLLGQFSCFWAWNTESAARYADLVILIKKYFVFLREMAKTVVLGQEQSLYKRDRGNFLNFIKDKGLVLCKVLNSSGQHFVKTS